MTPRDRWDNAFEAAYADPLALPRLECPNCGARTLRLIFVTDPAGHEDQGSADSDGPLPGPEPPPGRGMAAFWCDTCLHGLMPRYYPIPPHGEVAERGNEPVPNYHVVTE